MASKYYNPNLAKNLARAYQPPVYDFVTGVKQAVEPMVQQLKEQEARERLEAEKYERQMEKVRADQAADFRNMKSFDPNNLAEEFRPYATTKLYDLQQDYKFVVDNLQGFEKQKALTEINQKIDTLKAGNLVFAEYTKDYQDRYDPDQEGGSRISNINDAMTIELDRRKANREWDEVVEVDGVPHFIFNPREDSSFEEPVTISLDEFATAYKPLERQTAKYLKAQTDFDDLINTAKRDLRWENDPENLSQIESILEAQTYNEQEALSIAVDFLGLTQEAYAGAIMQDLDQDGKAGTIKDINYFIKDNLRTGVLTTLKNLHGAYDRQKAERDKEIANNVTDTQQKQQIMANHQNLLLDQLEFVNYPTDPMRNIDIASGDFANMLSQIGFSKVGKILDITEPDTSEGALADDEVVVDQYINIRNNYTNETFQVYRNGLTEDGLKRALLLASGMDPLEVDKYYPLTKNEMSLQPGGQFTFNEVTLPGATTNTNTNTQQ